MNKSSTKSFHNRSLHNTPYDFPALVKSFPNLSNFVSLNKYNNESIDFSNPEAVVALNTALLIFHYKISYWKVPKGSLCPPIPGRVDYIHYIADLLAESNNGEIPKGEKINALDIGTGASCIYPILGHYTYGWSFKASDICEKSILSANDIINQNKLLKSNFECRHQKNHSNIFLNIIKPNEFYDFTICNPPFHSSKEEALFGSQKKNKNLKNNSLKKGNKKKVINEILNFGGHENELWCPGGELEFITKMIKESIKFKNNCFWFTTLISKKDNLEKILKALNDYNIKTVKVINMKQGMKNTRFIAWTFLDTIQQGQWSKGRWN